MSRSRPGFRLSVRDVIVLGFAGGAAWWLWPRSVLAASLVLTVVGHFFLFCNVFRVPTRLELTWATLFLLNVVGFSQFGSLTPVNYLFAQLPITLIILALTLRHANYHGILWSKVNPDLAWQHDPSA